MASSSDAAKPVRGFLPPQNDAEHRLMRRVEELCNLARARGIPRYTGFLSDREQVLAQAAANRAGCDCIRFWGGYPGAERQVPLYRTAGSLAAGPGGLPAHHCPFGCRTGLPPQHRDLLL